MVKLNMMAISRVCISRRHRALQLLVLIVALLSVGRVTASEAVNSLGQADKQEPIVIGFLGDSLSAAYNLKPEQGWVALLEERLHAQSSSGSPQLEQAAPKKQVLTHSGANTRFINSADAGINAPRFINASISGATTDAGLQTLPALLKHHPDIVFLELGANDGLQGKPLPLIRQNLTLLIQQLQAAGAQVVLIGIRIPPNLGKRYTEPFFDQYAELAQTYDLTLVPFLLDGVAGNPELMMRDGLHPNAEGQKIIAENLWPVLQTVLSGRNASGHDALQQKIHP